MLRKIISVGSLGLLLTACATNPKLDPNYQMYLQTQKEIAQSPPKIVEIKAQPGQSIVLQGVSEFVVYAPSGSTGARVAIYHPKPDPATIIFSKLFDTSLSAVKTIFPAYFGWHYGAKILDHAIDRAGGNYNITGDYNTGQMTKVTGDYVPGTKYQVGQDYTGGNKITAGQNYAGSDIVGSDKTQGNHIVSGQDYTGQNKTDTTTTTTNTPTQTIYDNSTGSIGQ